jgi:hypothetical protein
MNLNMPISKARLPYRLEFRDHLYQRMLKPVKTGTILLILHTVRKQSCSQVSSKKQEALCDTNFRITLGLHTTTTAVPTWLSLFLVLEEKQ